MSPEHTPAPSLGPPSPPPKGSLTRAPSSFDVEVEEEQLIDWAQSEETSEARGPDRGPR